MTFPTQSRHGRRTGPPPAVDDEPFPHAAVDALIAAVCRLRRRHAGRLVVGYLLLVAVVAAAPAFLHHRVAGHVSVALLLVLAQLVIVVWSMAGHRRGAGRLDEDIEQFRHYLAEREHRRQGAW
ncbi:DUF485 domain-containing protein [Kitasatospora paranensis]|uniref:DUF485 domain-containing protein n=1 Tax=Kitasatospora paranensis TaxID=258053 RepID=A0ABW2G8T8_9ACTN